MATNKELDAKKIEAKVLDLSKSMERMKSRQAERDDVVVELKQSKRTRLELLARDLQPVFEQIPEGNDQFEFSLTNGETPRLWIDMTSHVRMGPDRREYELIKDTRMGRTILASSSDMQRMGQIVTDYVADKLLERERMLEGEWVAMSGYDFDGKDSEETAPIVAKPSRWRGFMWFSIGSILTLVSLFAWAWYGELPTFLQ